MRLSIILSVAGNDPKRTRNFNECIGCIEKQTFTGYEIIVVEQILDGKIYKTSKSHKHIKIEDKQSRRFNLSWCRNVGAREACGDTLILLDSDMVFESDYLEKISKFDGMFAAGAETYYWSRNKATDDWLANHDFNIFRRLGGDNHKVAEVFRFRSMTVGCGYGASLVYNRNWFLDCFGGYNENFFGYGWEDKAATDTIKVLLSKTDETLCRIPAEVAHLHHNGCSRADMLKNEKLYLKFKEYDQHNLASLIKTAHVGKKTEPTLI